MSHYVREGKLLSRFLEYPVVDHCNLKCADCSHLAPFMPPRYASPESLAADLERLAPVMHAEEFRLLGGEPLLHPELTDLARLVRRSGIADAVAVTTNGTLLQRLTEELWEQIDCLHVTLYAEAEVPAEDLAHLRARAAETGTRLSLTRRPRFRATVLTEPQPNDLLLRLIFRSCQSAHVCQYHLLDRGWLYRCPVPPGLPHLLQRLGEPGYDPHDDGLDLHAGARLRHDLQCFLDDPAPSRCCRYCLGEAGRSMPHRRLTRRELANPSDRPLTRASHLSLTALARNLAVRAWREMRGGPSVSISSPPLPSRRPEPLRG